MKWMKNEHQVKKIEYYLSSEASCMPSEMNKKTKFAKQIVP